MIEPIGFRMDQKLEKAKQVYEDLKRRHGNEYLTYPEREYLYALKHFLKFNSYVQRYGWVLDSILSVRDGSLMVDYAYPDGMDTDFVNMHFGTKQHTLTDKRYNYIEYDPEKSLYDNYAAMMELHRRFPQPEKRSPKKASRGLNTAQARNILQQGAREPEISPGQELLFPKIKSRGGGTDDPADFGKGNTSYTEKELSDRAKKYVFHLNQNDEGISFSLVDVSVVNGASVYIKGRYKNTIYKIRMSDHRSRFDGIQTSLFPDKSMLFWDMDVDGYEKVPVAFKTEQYEVPANHLKEGMTIISERETPKGNKHYMVEVKKPTKYDFKKVKYAQGGQVTIENENVDYTPERYRGILNDYDEDQIPNADDPHPQIAGDTETLEQTRFSDTFANLLSLKNELDSQLKEAVLPKLQDIAPDNANIYARTKTPFSILKKLTEKRLLDVNQPQKGLTDLIGTTMATHNKKQLNKARKLIEEDKVLGELIEIEDMYENPKNGYRAVHYLFWSGKGEEKIPVELQLKTERMKQLSILSHDAYKFDRLNVERLEYLSDLANKADEGDKEAARKFDELMKDPAAVKESLMVDKKKKGGIIEKFKITDAKEDLRDDS